MASNKYFNAENNHSRAYKRNMFSTIQSFMRLMSFNGDLSRLTEAEQKFYTDGKLFDEGLTKDEDLSNLVKSMRKLPKLVLEHGEEVKKSNLGNAVNLLFATYIWNSDSNYANDAFQSYILDNSTPVGFNLEKALDTLIDPDGKILKQKTDDETLNDAMDSTIKQIKKCYQKTQNVEENE